MFVARPHLNRYLDALTDPCYRHTLYYLNDHQHDPISIETVARHVKAFTVPYSSDTLVEADYAAVQQELCDQHLPQLADDGIIDFDPQNAIVRFRPSSRIFSVFLWVSYRIERPA